jgi:glycyl-radical enzyme activating protein family
MKGKIFNIQRFSIHDGPGARTIIFFKGCNLRCKWCHNPESISLLNQIEYYAEKCIECGACVKVCPMDAHYFDENIKHQLDMSKCDGCLLCTETCYSNALVAVGQDVDAEYLFNSILTDKLYFKNSSGGVTFSGGECMLQINFLAEVLSKCNDRGIHTAVDTAGNVPWSYFDKILSTTDLFLYDVKTADPIRHKEMTGVDNHLILENLKKLSDTGKEIFIRIPFIVGCNDDQIEAIGDILKPLHIKKVEVIPYHKLGISKYEALSIKNELVNIEAPSDESLEKAIAILKAKGLNVGKL